MILSRWQICSMFALHLMQPSLAAYTTWLEHVKHSLFISQIARLDYTFFGYFTKNLCKGRQSFPNFSQTHISIIFHQTLCKGRQSLTNFSQEPSFATMIECTQNPKCGQQADERKRTATQLRATWLSFCKELVYLKIHNRPVGQIMMMRVKECLDFQKFL